MPSTVELMGTACGVAKSLFGSFSLALGNWLTQNVCSGLMPVAVTRRSLCSPSAQSAAIAIMARASFGFFGTGSIFCTANPGE